MRERKGIELTALTHVSSDMAAENEELLQRPVGSGPAAINPETEAMLVKVEAELEKVHCSSRRQARRCSLPVV